ncbi:hypothetical protein [Geosporobacter ferrireducens]|uniref:Uncharacterized protein n=1 Tax=Geosporobacter ferrireducens TaxID=1424294 RepID=A0A1D8GK81_9FIRM|nr:hypothetical protein [Geosporobacter ferrireducens]AOT71321.1 hypothetical protein Gferi_18230 [Geosporobacter ferrireducens]MTI57630.1 hypothetical protein [Geosporobacter ferrireducens]
MQAEVVLTPTESKKLIAKAVFNMPEVQEALKNGIVAIHPSSSTVFLYQEIMGNMPQGLWVCGVIGEKGLCGSNEAVEMIKSRGPGAHNPLEVSKETWFFKKGILQESTALGEILEQMTERDVYIKGSNALDSHGNVGVLFANPAGGGGTIGKVMVAKRTKNFHVILPIGMEKLIPVTIEKASHAAGFKKVGSAMGIPSGLIPVSGKKIDEIDALFRLFGVEATPIAAGGLSGAEGSVVIAFEGSDEQVKNAFEMLKSTKGAQLPALNLPESPDAYYSTLSI